MAEDNVFNLKYMFYFVAMLKEVSKSPHEMILFPEMDSARLALYPTLDYTGLYSALESLLHSASSINTGLQSTYKFIVVIIY